VEVMVFIMTSIDLGENIGWEEHSLRPALSDRTS